MENEEEETLPVEATGEPQYNTYQLVWIQPDGTGVRQTVFEKSYAGAPSVYASHRQGSNYVREGSTGPNDSHLETPSVDNVPKATPGDDGDKEQRHHLKRQYSETCTSCGALYLDTSVSVDSDSDVSDSENSHGRSMIIRQFSNDSSSNAMAIVEPSPQNRRKFCRGTSLSRSASEDWVLQHVPYISGTHIPQRHGSGGQSNTEDVHAGDIPLNPSDREAWAQTRFKKGHAEVAMSMGRGIDNTLQSDTLYIPRGTSVVNTSTVDRGPPGQTGYNKERRIDGPEQVTITHHEQKFPESDPVYGQYVLRKPLLRYRALEQQIPHKIFRTSSLNVAQEEPAERQAFSVDNMALDWGDIPDHRNMNRTEPRLDTLPPETQDRYTDGIIQEESVLVCSPKRKAPNIISENVQESSVGRPVRDYHNTRFIKGSTLNTNQTSPYRCSQLHGSDSVLLTGGDVSYGAELEGDKQTFRPDGMIGTTISKGRGLQKPALTNEGPTDPVNTTTLYRHPFDSEAKQHNKIRTSDDADGGYRQMPGEVSEATIKDTTSPHDAMSGYQQLPGEDSRVVTIKYTTPSHEAASEVSEAITKGTRPSDDAASKYRQLPEEVSEAITKDSRPSHDAVSGYRHLPEEVSEAPIKDTTSPHDAMSGYRKLPGEDSRVVTIKYTTPSHEAASEVSEAITKGTRPSHDAASKYRHLPGDDSEAIIKYSTPSHDAVSGHRQLPEEVSQATVKDTTSPHDAVSGYRHLPGDVCEATIKYTMPSHDAVSGYRQLPGEDSEAIIKYSTPSHDAVSGHRQLPEEVSEATVKDTTSPHDAVSGYRHLPGDVCEATIKYTTPSHDAVSGYRQLPGEDSEATIRAPKLSHDAVRGYRHLPGEDSEAPIKDTTSPHDAVSGYRHLPGDVCEATIKYTMPSHDAVSGYRQLPGEDSEATIRAPKLSHDAVRGYRHLPGEDSEATIRAPKLSHDAVSGYRQLPGEDNEATIRAPKLSHDAVSGYRQLPGEDNEATIRAPKPSHDAVSGHRQLPGDVTEVIMIDTTPPHDTVSGCRQLPGELSEATSEEAKVTEQQQGPEKLSTQIVKQMRRPIDQAFRFKSPSLDIHANKKIHDTTRDRVVSEADGGQVHGPSIERSLGTDSKVDELHVVTASRNLENIKPVEVLSDQPDKPVTDNIPTHDSSNKCAHVQGGKQVTLDQKQPEQRAIKRYKDLHGSNLVPRENQHPHQPVEQTVSMIDDPKTPEVDVNRLVEEITPRQTDTVALATASGKLVTIRDQGPEYKPASVYQPHDNQFQGQTHSVFHSGYQDQLNKVRGTLGPGDPQLVVDRPDDDLLAEYMQLPGNSQVPIIQADLGQHVGRVASLDRNQIQRQRREPSRYDGPVLKSKDSPASIVPKKLKDDRDLNEPYTGDGDCTSTDITYKSIPADVSHWHVSTTKECPVISSTIAPSTNYSQSPAAEHLYIEETPLARRQQQCGSGSNSVINNELSTNETYSPVSEAGIQGLKLNRYKEISCEVLPPDLPESFTEMSLLFIDHKETFLVNTQRAVISGGRKTFVAIPIIEIDEAITVPDRSAANPVPVEEDSVQQENTLCLHSPLNVADIHPKTEDKDNDISNSEWSSRTANVPAADCIESQGCKDGEVSIQDELCLKSPLIGRADTLPNPQIADEDGGVPIHDELYLKSPLIGRADTLPNPQIVDEDAQSSEWSSQTASMPVADSIESKGGNDGGVSIYDDLSLQGPPLARRQQQCGSGSDSVINNELSTNETYSPVSEAGIQGLKLSRYKEISCEVLPPDLPESFTEMSLLFIDHKETFLVNTQRPAISGDRKTFVAIPIIEIDEAITVPDRSAANPVPVEEDSVQQENTLCLHSPLNVADIHPKTEDKDNDISNSEWSSQTANVPAADCIASQGCKDGEVSIQDELCLKSPLIDRANTLPNPQIADEDGGVPIHDELYLKSPLIGRADTLPNPQIVDEDAQSSEWSSQTASMPVADSVESKGDNDGGVSIYDELSLQGPLTRRIDTPPYVQVVEEDAQSSEWCNTRASAPPHVHSDHTDDLPMPVYEETSLQIRTHKNTDGVDTSLPVSEWSSPTVSDPTAAHLKSKCDDDGGTPIYAETSLQIKTRSNTDGVDTSAPSSDWSSQTSFGPSARPVHSQSYGAGGTPVYGEASLCISKPNDDVRDTSPGSEWSNRTVRDPSAGTVVSPYYGASGLWTNDGPEQRQILLESPSDRPRGNTHDMITPVHTRVLHSRRPYPWYRMPVDMRQGDGSLPCHVCQSLLPLLDRINNQLRDLEAQEPTPYEEEGLRNDMDRVFESLYAAIDQREEQLLASVGDTSPHSGTGEVDLASLLAHLENTKSYCDKTLVYTTKPELLSLTGMIHTRADELLSQEIAEPAPPSNVVFRDDGLPDLVEEIEKFGKVFNEKDVDAAVKENTFPKEHKLSDNDLILEQRRSSLQSMPPVRRGSMPPYNDGRDTNSMPHNAMPDRNNQPVSVAPRRGSRDVGYNGYPVGNEGFPPHDPYRRDGLPDPERRSQEMYPHQRNDPIQDPDDRRQNAYDPRTGDRGPNYQTPVDRRYEPTERPYDQRARHAEPLYQDDGRYDTRGNPHDPRTRDTGNDSSGTFPHRQMPHSGYTNEGNQPVGRPSNRDEIMPDQASQLRSTPNQYGEAPRQDLTADQPAPNEADTFPGSSALAVYLHAHQQKLRDSDDIPATKDTMIFSITPEPDSDRDAILSVSPKVFQHEHLIKCVYMEFDKGTVYEENHVTRDGKLVNDPPSLPSPNTSWRFMNYKGALSTRPLDGTGMSYLEFWTDIEIKQVHGGRSLIFEAAVADRDVIDLHHKAEDQIHAWGVSLSNCPEHDGLCRRTWGAGQKLTHYPHTLPNQPDSKARLRFGFLIMQKQKKLMVIDCNEEKVLLTADDIKISRPLWPVFGVYNTDLSHVETSFVSGTNLKMDRNIAWLILQNM